MGTKVKLSAELGETVHVADSIAVALSLGPERIFRAAEVLCIDGIAWDADLAVIHKGLVSKARAFKAPFLDHPPEDDVAEQVRRLIQHAGRVFAMLYPTFRSVAVRTSFRPMVTGPEPLHFDTWEGEAPLVTAYINISLEARRYGIGTSFPALVASQPRLMRHLSDTSSAADLSYEIRTRTMTGQPPLGPETPKHGVEFAPGAIWFFNAKTVSHEVIYGTGAVGLSWEVPDCGARLQREFLRECT